MIHYFLMSMLTCLIVCGYQGLYLGKLCISSGELGCIAFFESLLTLLEHLLTFSTRLVGDILSGLEVIDIFLHPAKPPCTSESVCG